MPVLCWTWSLVGWTSVCGTGWSPRRGVTRSRWWSCLANVGAAGGGPGDDIVRASEISADDAVVEWPQGGERLRGKANIIGFRSTYPARQQFELHRTTGCHDLWVNEYTMRYDDQPVMVVGIMELRDDKVVRERIYFGDPWEPPAWRAHWVERFDPREPDSLV